MSYRAIVFNALRQNFKVVSIYDCCFLIPVFLMLGISLYFGLHFEPHLLLNLVVLLFTCACAYYTRRLLFIILAIIGLGFFVAQLKVIVTDTKIINKSIYKSQVVARVCNLNKKEGYTQLIIDGLEGMERVRIAVRTKIDPDIKVGDLIKLSAKLFPPSNAVAVYGYDFSKFAFFNHISAVGYATSEVKVVQRGETLTFSHYIDWWRNKIDDFFRANMDSPEHYIASALIVGKKDVPRGIMENIRGSGLSHLLAISGLHLSLVASLFFISMRWVLSRFPYLALNFPIKKISALLGIIMVSIYLFISGMSISAQRAYIMVMMVCIAIMFDRESSTMHSVVIAATAILLFEPEAVISPSFQMSFSAVIALIRFGHVYRNYLLSIVWASFIATVFTLPYSVYHFNYYALGGIFANVIAIPIATFISVPFGLISALICSELAYPFLWVMSKSISILIMIADYFASWEMLIINMHSFSHVALMLMSVGIIWFSMWPNHLNYLGLVFVVLGIMLACNYTSPDLMVESNNVAFKGQDSRLYFLNARQRKNFVSRSWLLSNGQSEVLSYLKHDNKPKLWIASYDGETFWYYNRGNKVAINYIKGKVSLDYNGHNIDSWIVRNEGPIFIWMNRGALQFPVHKRPWNH